MEIGGDRWSEWCGDSGRIRGGSGVEIGEIYKDI